MAENIPVFDIELAKLSALAIAENAYNNGALFDTMPDENQVIPSHCDPETLYSIAELTLIEGLDGMTIEEARPILINTLEEAYPNLPKMGILPEPPKNGDFH